MHKFHTQNPTHATAEITCTFCSGKRLPSEIKKTTYPSIYAQSMADNYKVFVKTVCLQLNSYSKLHIQNFIDQKYLLFFL